ncbi:MAG: sigma-70 family RNA polymerase sigma factor [archaeon]
MINANKTPLINSQNDSEVQKDDGHSRVNGFNRNGEKSNGSTKKRTLNGFHVTNKFLGHSLRWYWKNGLIEEFRNARRILTQTNTRLAQYTPLIRSYLRRRIRREEVVQEARRGIFDATLDYNPSMGEFSTHARTHIIKRLDQLAFDRWSDITGLPYHLWTKRKGVAKAKSRLKYRGKEITDEAVADLVNLAVAIRYVKKEGEAPTRSRINAYWDTRDRNGDRMYRKLQPYQIHSLEVSKRKISTHGKEFKDRKSESPLSSMLHVESLEIVRVALNQLDQREQTIIKARYGLEGKPQTLKQVGETIGLTRERVRQIESEALEKLKDKYTELYLPS